MPIKALSCRVSQFLAMQFHTTKMLSALLFLVVVSLSHWAAAVVAQPLEAAQHTALMDVYDVFGSSSRQRIPNLMKFFFSFLFLRQDAIQRRVRDSVHRPIVLVVDCIVPVAKSRDCAVLLKTPTRRLTENAFRNRRLFSSDYKLSGAISSTIGQLTALTHLYIVLMVLLCKRLTSIIAPKVFEQQPIERHIADDDRTIDGTHLLVRYCFECSWAHIRFCARRNVGGNDLNGTIPATIWQLTALTQLCVVAI